jgi:pimeloyl-ACP methyl ester carboxylesterase
VKLVLLHAFPYGPGMWEPQRALLADHDVEAPSLYGRGNTMDAWASSLLGEIRGDFVAVGASMGGGCAVAMIRQAQERIRAIVLSGAHAGPDPPERRAQREETIAKLRAQGSAAVWEGEGPSPPAEELIAAVEALRDRPDDRETVRSLQVPLLVVVGDSDVLVDPEAARALAASAPLGEFHLVENAGHLPSLEHPGDFNQALGEFLGKL